MGSCAAAQQICLAELKWVPTNQGRAAVTWQRLQHEPRALRIGVAHFSHLLWRLEQNARTYAGPAQGGAAVSRLWDDIRCSLLPLYGSCAGCGSKNPNGITVTAVL